MGGGVIPPKKAKRGAQLAGRGPWHAGIANFLKRKDFFAENLGNFWKKVVLLKISGTFVFEKITSTPPPPPRRQHFPLGGGPWNVRGPKFWNTPPQPETGWHGPDQANKTNARILKAHSHRSHSMSGGSI